MSAHGLLTPEQKALITDHWRENPNVPASAVTAWVRRTMRRRIGETTARLFRPAAPKPEPPPAKAKAKATYNAPLTPEEREKVRGLWKLNRDAAPAVVAALARELLGRPVSESTAASYKFSPETPRPRKPPRPLAEVLGYASPVGALVVEHRRIWKRHRRDLARRASA